VLPDCALRWVLGFGLSLSLLFSAVSTHAFLAVSGFSSSSLGHSCSLRFLSALRAVSLLRSLFFRSHGFVPAIGTLISLSELCFRSYCLGFALVTCTTLPALCFSSSLYSCSRRRISLFRCFRFTALSRLYLTFLLHPSFIDGPFVFVVFSAVSSFLIDSVAFIIRHSSSSSFVIRHLIPSSIISAFVVVFIRALSSSRQIVLSFVSILRLRFSIPFSVSVL
jgi:hypothetical protein